MNENDIAREIVDAALCVHRYLGPGLLESVYETVLSHELRKRGFQCDRQLMVPVVYDGMRIELGYRLDILVNDLVIIELKSVEALHPVYKKQLLTYLRLANKRLGILLNFNAALLKDGGIVRIVNGMADPSSHTIDIA